jgi:hypothetical protein
MRNLIKFVFVVSIVLLFSDCHRNIDGSSTGEHQVVYLGNLYGDKLVSGVDGYVLIRIDVDDSGSSDMKAFLPNSYIPALKAVGKKKVHLLVLASGLGNWGVVRIITEPNIQDYFKSNNKD